MNPSYRGRGRSIAMPDNLRRHYEAARDDPERLSLIDTVSRMKALLDEAWEQMRDGTLLADAVFTSAAAVGSAWRRVGAASRSGDEGRLAEAMTALGEAINSLAVSVQPAAAQRELREQTVKLGKAIESGLSAENKRLVDLHGMIEARAAIALMHETSRALVEALNEHVADDATRNKIRRDASRRLAELTNRRSAPALGPGDAGDGPDDPPAENTGGTA